MVCRLLPTLLILWLPTLSAGCGIAPTNARADLARVTALDPARWADDWSDSDWIERVNAAATNPGDARATTATQLASIAARHPSPVVRIGALEALVPLGDPSRVDALRGALRDPSASVREFAAGVALPIVGADARPTYAALLADSQPASVRRAALMALVDAPPNVDSEPDLLVRVVACLGDVDPGVRFHACALLAKSAPDGPVDADPRVAADSWREWWRQRALRSAPARSAP